MRHCQATKLRRSLAGSVLTGILHVFPFQDEFSLGEWDRSEVTGEGEGLIHRGQRADGEAGAIVLEVRFFHVYSCHFCLVPTSGGSNSVVNFSA